MFVECCCVKHRDLLVVCVGGSFSILHGNRAQFSTETVCVVLKLRCGVVHICYTDRKENKMEDISTPAQVEW